MNILERAIKDISDRAEQIGIPISHILAEANVDEATWWRWKNKKSSPTMSKLGRVTASLEKFERKAGKKAA